jgi:hypothetical protein
LINPIVLRTSEWPAAMTARGRLVASVGVQTTTTRSGFAPTNPEQWLQRVGILCELPRVLEELRIDPAPILAAAGLSSHALRRSDDRIAFGAVPHVLREASRRLKRPQIGLLVGSVSLPPSLGRWAN